MRLNKLKLRHDKLQEKYGDPKYNPIYWGGKTNEPQLAFVYMNPTARNVSSHKDWQGVKAPWLGTKSVWRFYGKLDLFPEQLSEEVQEMQAEDWTDRFSKKVYGYLKEKGVYVTNLAKCTQADARRLSNEVFKKYLPLFHQEMRQVSPKIIITFGNQVSSILLEQSISVSQVRKKPFSKKIEGDELTVFPVYYPVGQGMRNMGKAIDDIRWIIQNYW